MTKRIFRAICAVSLAVLLAGLALVMQAMYGYFSRVQLSQLRAEAELAAHLLSREGDACFADLDVLPGRVTWVAGDGSVLYDSELDPAAMENHLQREEIQQALETGTGVCTRFSATRIEETLYCAKRLPDGTVVRLSGRHASLLMLLAGMSQVLALVILTSVGLSAWLAHHVSKRIVRPLNGLNLEKPLSGENYAELRPLLGRIDLQQRQLAARDSELRRQQREFDAVAKNMTEGLVLMSEGCNVLTMNPAAARILGLPRPYVGVNFLTLGGVQAFAGTVEQALAGTHGELRTELGSNIYQIDASPVRSGEAVTGAVVLMFDVTEKQQLEQQRREFTANISHELKTPLHAISGYAELLQAGLAAPEDVPAFGGKIREQSARMIRLVEDILKLARLDEGGGALRCGSASLYGAADAAVRSLRDTADAAGITLTLTGEACTVSGDAQLLDAIVTNLVSNAVKYNRPGGRVTVSVKSDDGAAVLTVADTGIGIPQAHQARIFERFYRVDKSHSKAVGGTGLGLAIVKHASRILGAQITLHSTEGLGSTFTVRFPAPQDDG